MHFRRSGMCLFKITSNFFFWSTVYRQIPTVRLYYVMYLRIYEMMSSVLP